MKIYPKGYNLSRVKVFVSPMKIVNDNMYFMTENQGDLVDFLLREMSVKKLVPADITRRSGLSPSQVSKVLNRESPAGSRAIECFAKTLDLPVTILLQYAGKLPKLTNSDPREQELVHLFGMMSAENRDDTIDYARMKLEKQERENKKDGKRARVG
jgi:transcriptional regulator with XRE-family HTH domain